MDFSLLKQTGHRFKAKKVGSSFFVVTNAYDGDVEFFDANAPSKISDVKYALETHDRIVTPGRGESSSALF